MNVAVDRLPASSATEEQFSVDCLQVNLERARADDASDRLTQIASLVDSEWMRGPQVTASEAQHVAERGIAKLRSQVPCSECFGVCVKYVNVTCRWC